VNAFARTPTTGAADRPLLRQTRFRTACRAARGTASG
jgi:hypothetical protein